MRLSGLTWAPPGLYPDEAMNGNNALEANRTGDYKTFYPDNNGREAIFIHQAQSIKLFAALLHYVLFLHSWASSPSWANLSSHEKVIR